MMSETQPAWEYLPTPALLSVFSYLNYKELSAVGEVCKRWFSLSRDEFLWKELFYYNFNVDRSVNIIQGKSWCDEFKRLCDQIPLIQTEYLDDHLHQVLHVSFSHNGEYFATTSKDGFVLVWTSTYPAEVKFHRDMKAFSWKYTQYSQFNESDTLLLVSGVHFGSPYSTSGEIAVFNLQDGFQLQCRVMNKPYDIFGTWYSDQYLLSGDLHWLAHLVSTSVLWINKASQEIDSEHVPVTHLMYKFYNRNASSIRAIMVANCLPNSENAEDVSGQKSMEVDANNKEGGEPEHGNPVSHRDINLPSVSNQVVVPMRPNQIWRKSSDGFEYATPIRYNREYRKVESEKRDNHWCSADDDEEDSALDDDEDVDDTDSEEERAWTHLNLDAMVGSNPEGAGDEGEQIVKTDKYLIFTTGFKTYTPHQIGFKRIKPYNFPKRMDPGPSLKERLVLRERKKELMRSSSPPPEPNWLDYDSVCDRFDKVDHVIDLHGHIIGMGLSPDQRYLYVNSRPWPQGYVIRNPLDPPPIAQEIDIHVIDLVTLKQVGTMLRAHKAYTPNNECFFIFLAVCEEYVASGAEDKHGYLWDRHYGMCLAKFPHLDVVNSVAFNPKDPEMLVTTSDDQRVKIWRSKAAVRRLGLLLKELPSGIEVRKASSQSQRGKSLDSRFCPE